MPNNDFRVRMWPQAKGSSRTERRIVGIANRTVRSRCPELARRLQRGNSAELAQQLQRGGSDRSARRGSKGGGGDGGKQALVDELSALATLDADAPRTYVLLARAKRLLESGALGEEEYVRYPGHRRCMTGLH